jgi:hypothetical protein
MDCLAVQGVNFSTPFHLRRFAIFRGLPFSPDIVVDEGHLSHPRRLAASQFGEAHVAGVVSRNRIFNSNLSWGGFVN